MFHKIIVYLNTFWRKDMIFKDKKKCLYFHVFE